MAVFYVSLDLYIFARRSVFSDPRLRLMSLLAVFYVSLDLCISVRRSVLSDSRLRLMSLLAVFYVSLDLYISARRSVMSRKAVSSPLQYACLCAPRLRRGVYAAAGWGGRKFRKKWRPSKIASTRFSLHPSRRLSSVPTWRLNRRFPLLWMWRGFDVAHPHHIRISSTD